MSAMRFFLSAVFAINMAAKTWAQEASQAEVYQACLKKTESTPKEAFEDAIQWHGEGGGGPAEHCAASALMTLGLYIEAAKRLESLAHSVKEGPHFKSRVLDQAVLAWLLAGDPKRAEAVATSALKLTPKIPALLIGRARARAELGDYFGAKTDLDLLITTIPNHTTALAFRAAALRYLNKRTAALADVNAALAVDPGHPEALLERGILKRLANDKIGARVDWLRLIEIAPHSGAAKIARTNLEKMDLIIPQEK